MLSLASRIVLIQASSAAIPAYVMQCAQLPSKILDGIDRVNRNFLQGSLKSAKKIHQVGRQKVTKLKGDGGLGLQSARGRNTTLLAKLNWRYHTDKEASWAQVLWSNANKLPCCPIWKAMKKAVETFDRGSRWLIGRESNLKVWSSNWTNKGSLRQLIQGLLPLEASQLENKDFCQEAGQDWSKIPFDLPLEIKMLIQATSVLLTSRGRDILAWSESPNGNFNLKSAYVLASGFETMTQFLGSWIWKANILPRIKTFLWMCVQNSIGVKTCLVREGVVEKDMCPICLREPETIIHSLQDCSRTRHVWRQLSVMVEDRDFWEKILQDWLIYNGSLGRRHIPSDLQWKVVFPFAVWLIWKSRIQTIFGRKNTNPKLAFEILSQAMEYTHCVSSPRPLSYKSIKRIRWERPPEGWMNLNTDGFSIDNPRLGGCGGVVRDENGRWIAVS